MTHQELTAAISNNLKQIVQLNSEIGQINVNLKANLANGHFHLLTAIEVKVMRINNLLFWVQHWTDALAKVGA